MAKGQKARTKKVSQGTARGAKKSPQTDIALVLMGKGKYQSLFPNRTTKRTAAKNVESV